MKFLIKSVNKSALYLGKLFFCQLIALCGLQTMLASCGAQEEPQIPFSAVESTEFPYQDLAQLELSLNSGQGGSTLPDLPEPNAKPVGNLLKLCEGVARADRPKLLGELGGFGKQGFASRAIDKAMLSSSKDRCVLGLLPAALYTNLRTGVPASILVSQAIQETGWCKSELAQRGFNFHGQKNKFDKSHFSFWWGESLTIYSSESPSGGGNKVPSSFMKFDHLDQSFYSVAERFLVPGLPYNSCMRQRSDSAAFIKCVGKSWAVHTDYAQVVMNHRANFRSASRPNLRLASCDLPPSEWQLHNKFKN